ncbi:MAG: HAD family hydrolase [Chloroflexota bacterium]
MLAVSVVLFDLGGTLFYDRAAAWPRVYRRAEAALWKVLRDGGVRVPPATLYGKPDTLLNFYYTLRGLGTEEPGTFRVLKDLLALHNPAIPDSTVARALRAMYAVTQTNWHVEDDAAQTLRELLERGFRLGAVSNGSDDQNAFELLDKADLRRNFEIVLTSAAHGRRKPDASIFQAALDHFRVGVQQAVMIGDSYEADVLGAHALGLRAVWITRRVKPLPAVRPIAPEAIISALKELPATLA